MKTETVTGKKSAIYSGLFLISLFLLLSSCKKDSLDTSLPTMKLTPDNVMGKTAQHVDVTLTIYASNGIESLEISTVNLKVLRSVLAADACDKESSVLHEVNTSTKKITKKFMLLYFFFIINIKHK